MMNRVLCVFAAALLLAACSGKKKANKDKPVNKPTTTTENKQPDPNAAEAADAAAFAKECAAGLEKAKKLLPELLAVKGKRTIENTLALADDMGMAIDESNSLSGLMQSVHPDEKVRDAARACEQEVSKFTTDLGLNKELYRAYVDLDTSGFDADTKRLVEHSLRDFRRNGVDKDDATRKRLKQINEELTKLGQQFSKNIVDDVREINVDGPDDLKGLPADWIKEHKPDPKTGKIKVTTNYPDYIPFINYAESTKWRREIYIKNRSRGGVDNEKLLKQILTLRWEKAHLLGYNSWADYATEDKMMKSGKNAEKFIARVMGVVNKRSDKDYAELLARKRKDDKGAKFVEDYEKGYYENKVKSEEYAFDPQSVRPYFKYENVEKGLLSITSKMYDISYAPAKDAKLWHPSVKAFDVMNAGGENLGRIYLDMHPREGKYKHAAQFTLRTGVEGKQLPAGVLVCNFPDPAKTDGPALMEHAQVTTMFHEFGHLMHHILGGHQRWLDQSGVATEWDFVEAPSQMFEEWAWNYDTLKTFAKRYDTGEVITKDIVARMRRAHDFGLGERTAQQMFYASVSLNFHSVDPAKLNMHDEVKRLQTKLTPFRFVDGTMFHANFGHLNGYSAIYYTYMWSLVIAKDMLTPFQKNGLMNSEWTRRYRDKILAPGGTKDAADLVKDFLGREFNYDAFETYLGG